MKSMSVEHLFVKPITATIAGEEIEVPALDAESSLSLFGKLSDENQKEEAIKELVWLTIKKSGVYHDLPEDKNKLFSQMSLGGLKDWLNATIKANHLGEFVDKKKVTDQSSV